MKRCRHAVQFRGATFLLIGWLGFFFNRQPDWWALQTPVQAQEAEDTTPPENEPAQAEEEPAPDRNDADGADDQPAGGALPNKVVPRTDSRSNRSAAPNELRNRTRPPSSSPSRNSNGRRERDSRSGSRNRNESNRPTPTTSTGSTNQSAGAGESKSASSSAGKADYAAFKPITERNIFNTARTRQSGRSRSEERRPPRVDTLTLVGTLVSEKGAFAFFEGSSAEFRKVLEMGKSMSGWKVASVTPEMVKLEADSTAFELQVGRQLRREEGGEWHLVGASAAPKPTSDAGDPSASGSSDSEDEIVKRMMQQREQELK